MNYCSACGAPMKTVDWPHECRACAAVFYRNPTSVAILLLSTDKLVDGRNRKGVLIGRRPQNGIADTPWALIGGFVECSDQTIESAAIRECMEETGIDTTRCGVRMVDSAATPNNQMLILCQANWPSSEEELLAEFVPSAEILEVKIVYAPCELAFPLHTRFLKEFFWRIDPTL